MSKQPIKIELNQKKTTDAKENAPQIVSK